MKKLACTLTLGALLAGACASGAGPRTAPEAALPAVATDAMVERDPVPDADEMTATTREERDGSDVVDLTSERPPDPAAAARCQTLLAEVERRDELGLFDEENDEDDEDELSEEEIENYQLEPPPIDGGVMGPDERPTFPAMPDELDVASLQAEELWTAVEECFESGLVTDDEDELDADDEAEMAEFCAELAGLSADEVAEWVAEEGDEVVDEEFGWCELVRPDRQ